MGAARRNNTTLLELSRARAEALLRSDQEAVTEREEAARAKAKEVRERIARRKAYGNRAASPARPRQSPPASANSSARSTSTTSSGARTRHASPKPARAAEPQAKLQAKPDPQLATSLMLNGLFERPSLSDTSQRSSISDPPSTTGWRCHALAETPRPAPPEPAAPAATADSPEATAQAALYSQHITALTDQIEALAACLREEQTARRSAEEKLKRAQEQVRALSSRSGKARAGSPLSGWDSSK